MVENLLGYTVQFHNYSELINLFEELFIHQVYLFKSTNVNPHIVDGGSNIGLSILFFKKIYPSCRILAFEPDLKSYELLCRNIAANHLSSVTLFHAALSNQEGTATLFSHKNEPGSLTMRLINSSDVSNGVIVPVKKVSTYIHEEVDLLKLDVEGSEIDILQDLIQSQKLKLIKQLILEFHPVITQVSAERFIETLSQNKFKCRYEKDQLHPRSDDWMIQGIKE
jgi:FkbM family methyltransferase